jgi:hypothetical protein
MAYFMVCTVIGFENAIFGAVRLHFVWIDSIIAMETRKDLRGGLLKELG